MTALPKLRTSAANPTRDDFGQGQHRRATELHPAEDDRRRVARPAGGGQQASEARQIIPPPEERAQGRGGSDDVGRERDVEDDGVHGAGSGSGGRSWASEGVPRQYPSRAA